MALKHEGQPTEAVEVVSSLLEDGTAATIPPLTRSDSEDESSMDLTRSDSDDSMTTRENEEESSEDHDSTHLTALLDISRQFQESLKYKEAEKVSPLRRDDNKRPCVHFDTTVSGVEISSHRDYPESVRQRIWSTLYEIQTNANRNIIEFRADNWDWKNATEEDCMLVESVGRLVHPASFEPPKVSRKRKQQSDRKRATELRRRKARQYAN